MSFVKDFFSGIYNLFVGLLVTGKHLGRHAITLQYPKERWTMPERSRGVVVLLSDPESGELNCTACLLCMKGCPTAAISIDREKNPETKRWAVTKFVIDNTICCFCGLCEEACNFDAIKLTGKYEFSVFGQGELIYDMERLTELGRDVKYTPRKKKKPAAAKPAQKETAADADKKPEAKKESGPETKPAVAEAENPERKAETNNSENDKPNDIEPDKPAEAKQEDLDLDQEKDKKESGS